jgi:hypothetical protein
MNVIVLTPGLHWGFGAAAWYKFDKGVHSRCKTSVYGSQSIPISDSSMMGKIRNFRVWISIMDKKMDGRCQNERLELTW